MNGRHVETTDQEIAAFRAEADRKVAEDREMVKRLRQNPPKYSLFTAVSVLMILFSGYLIVLFPAMLYVWLIAGLLLYSYNYIILLIPTTTGRKIRMREYIDFGSSYRDIRELVLHLISKRRKLAIEIGLTIFLSGMVPLALSFYVIFGMGMAFAIYLGFVSGGVPFDVAVTIVVQLSLIIAFLTAMVLLEPQAQGITRIASDMRYRLRRARYRGRRALTLISVVVVGALTLSAVLIIGAVLVPGGTLLSLLADLSVPEQLGVILVLGMLVAESFIMRHFQVYSSRRMAANLLEERATNIENHVIRPIDASMAQDGGKEDHCLLLENIKATYYSWVIYDVVEQNLFGRSPIYLVAPKIGYIQNETILDYVHPLTDNGRKKTGGEDISTAEAGGRHD